MLDKYITIKDKTIIAKQTSTGRWIIDALPADNTKELELLIGEVNRILNKYNTDTNILGKNQYIGNDKSMVRGIKK